MKSIYYISKLELVIIALFCVAVGVSDYRDRVGEQAVKVELRHSEVE